jgi:outer membrane protein TolC
LPSELLERRPDIKRAEAELAGANADVGAAKAAMFPSIALTATGGYANQEVANLIRPDSAFYSLASGLLAPIFQGGRLSGEYERTLARHEELVQGYRQTIVAAFRDVKDALAAIEKLDLQESAQTEAVAQAWVAHRLALLRYEAGQVDYLAVLITDRGLLNARNALVDIRLGRLAAFVDLYQALGGGWVDEANGSTPS